MCPTATRLSPCSVQCGPGWQPMAPIASSRTEEGLGSRRLRVLGPAAAGFVWLRLQRASDRPHGSPRSQGCCRQHRRPTCSPAAGEPLAAALERALQLAAGPGTRAEATPPAAEAPQGAVGPTAGAPPPAAAAAAHPAPPLPCFPAPVAMVRLTLIARVRDGLPLAEGLDADKEHEMYSYKSQAKVGAGGQLCAYRLGRRALAS